MRVSRAFAVVAGVCAAVGPCASPAAAGHGPGAVTVAHPVHRDATSGAGTEEGCGRGGPAASDTSGDLPLPMSGAGEDAAHAAGRTTPGHHDLSARCGDDVPTTTHGPAVRGGVDGPMGPSTTDMRVGVGLIAAAALGGGVFAVRGRRTRDERV
ncbi:hypothetical protein ACPXCE_02985 [Streptomyces sp. DT24]|uniref:hypothetical protein n=1 Tax=Streptomyces sp. DT24 TaxID=3416520 RepID=UPI003CF36BB1